MANFAFLKEIFYGIGSIFEFTFQILPPIGIVVNWILTFILIGLLAYWCFRLIGFTNKDKRVVDHRQPHNFID
ncbi:hypothetical protein GO491_07850 [Flavobacteriaceae bacterium Ap0902]|nr:hypothetical protein [Flavobacteriaceae bacterium Ap0902]